MHQLNYGPATQNQTEGPWTPRTEATSVAHSLSPTIEHRANEVIRVRRRNRQINSCLECRRRKLKCDRQAPCTNCSQSMRDCQYLGPAKDARSQRRFAEMKDRMGAVEDDLKQGMDSSNTRSNVGGSMVYGMMDMNIRPEMEAGATRSSLNRRLCLHLTMFMMTTRMTS
jgi:hypothetical protein